jgi:NAD(P)-dependent dehydrogenase (short-subunit alcohol dehydrogenase family)
MLASTALVTGSSTGLGRSIVQRLVRDGWRVAVNSRSAERAVAAASEIDPSGRQTVAVAGNVADPSQAVAVVENSIEQLGTLDLLVNNAGIAAEAPSVELALDEWKAILSTNLVGAVICSREAGRHMLERGRGTIVNVGSLWANFGMPQRAAYATSKHGLHGLTGEITRCWGPRGVRAVSVDPAYIATAMAASVAGGGAAELVARTPIGRLGKAEEVADAVAFLARTQEIRGVSLRVDGGWMAYGGW